MSYDGKREIFFLILAVMILDYEVYLKFLRCQRRFSCLRRSLRRVSISYYNMIKVYVDEGNLEQANLWYEKMVQNGCLQSFQF